MKSPSRPTVALLVVVACTFAAAAGAASGELGSGCDGPNRCIRASECRRSFNKQKREREPVLFNCGFEGLNLLVCCPMESATRAPGEDSHGNTLVPTGQGRPSPAVHATTARPQQQTTPSYVNTRPTSQAAYTERNPTTSRPNNEHSTQRMTHVENKPTQRTTSVPYRPRIPATVEQRSTENPYVRTTTLRPNVATTPKYNQYPSYVEPTVDSRFTTEKQNSFPMNPQLNNRPSGHFVTHGSPDPYDQEVPVRASKPEVYAEETVRPVQHSGVNVARPSANTGDFKDEAPYHTDEFVRPKRPASPNPQDIVFEEEIHRPPPSTSSHNNRPSYEQRPTTVPPMQTQTSFLPPRRPFETPYIGPEGPPVATFTQRPSNQGTRPAPRPPNSSSTNPGANNVGSGESGPLWPPSSHHNTRPQQRPSTQRPGTSNSASDLTQHPNIRLLPRDMCGTSAAGADRIINGKNATLGQFPWMALLGYKASEATEDFVTVCGGTLISWKYVLTAGHCLKTSVRLVRLGEHVISTDPDCDQDMLCADSVVDMEIEAKLPHHSYGKPYLKNDIGLIRMRQALPGFFSSYVRPICLPLVKEKEVNGRRLIVAGWGITRRGSKISSDVMQTAFLPELANAECNEAQEDDALKPVLESQMCAAVTSHGASTCYGDSGGPLMDVQQLSDKQFETPVVVQLGIVSLGSDDCGLQGAPSIYTRVSFFTRWILDTMRD